ncbi:MAG: AAA family ATPase, partial [Thermoplasmata archaeon]|nr:AAA family ATPase [Thermoplasmata archaeon]
MYLKKLVMENFKSFRGRVVVPFPRGFTGITGPNGSGKSNIADAILFIIGKSSRALRAQRQTDLIFNGGPNGRPANRCSVEVIFDNTDRLIPFDSDEVHFTKVVKRKPAAKDQEERYSTAYYLNGKRVTAAEFERLFSSSRISTDAYNIIQQGDVNHLVDMGPTERRRVLEAISGIATFDAEINRAMEQKARAEEKLERILDKKKDIELEVRRLKSSVERALKYKELKKELKKTRMEALVKELYLVLKGIDEKKAQITKNTSERSKLEEELPKVERKIQEAAQRIDELDEEIARMGGEEARKIKEKLDSARREYFEVKARIERAQDAMESEDRVLKDIKKRLKDLRGFVKEIMEEEGELKDRLEELQGNLKKVAEEIRKREESLETGDKALREMTFRIRELSEKVSDLKTRLAASEERLKGVEATFREVQGRVEEVEEEIETEKYEIKRARLTLKEIKNRAKEIAKLEEHRNHLMRLQARERELKGRIERLGEKLRKLDVRLREKELSGGMDGRRRAVMEVLSYRDRGEIEGILGTVGELMSVPKEYEKAIVAAAGGYIYAILVEDDSVMEKVSKKLKENKIGRVHLI